MKYVLLLFSFLLSGCAGQTFNRVHFCISTSEAPELSCGLAIVDLDALHDLEEGDAIILMKDRSRIYITTQTRR